VSKRIKNIIIYVAATLVVVALFTLSSWAREIVDMAGRRVIVPETITKVYSSSPPATYMIYAIAPDLLVGLNFPPTEQEKRYLRKNVPTLPVIGGFFGQGQTANIEMLLKVKPDVIIVWMWKQNPPAQYLKFEETMNKFQIPIFYLLIDHLSDYPDAFLSLGRLFKKEERAKRLRQYGQEALSEVHKIVAGISSDRKQKAYYAEGVDGLNTECENSVHAELILLSGGQNVHLCKEKNQYGMEKVSLEQVMLYNPDVIVAQEKGFYDKIVKEKDPAWQNVKAVKEGRVYLIPKHPFNWFDRPPSFMRILGLKWLINCLYPNEYKIDIVKEAQTFYSLFLSVDVSNDEMKGVIYP
jgi:iron complex transport system substrate-binding protein